MQFRKGATLLLYRVLVKSLKSDRLSRQCSRQVNDLKIVGPLVAEFAEYSHSPVASALWGQDLITYDSSGALILNTQQVKAQAAAFVRELRDASYPRDYFVRAYQEAAPRARDVSSVVAEKYLDRDYAARARALLL